MCGQRLELERPPVEPISCEESKRPLELTQLNPLRLAVAFLVGRKCEPVARRTISPLKTSRLAESKMLSQARSVPLGRASSWLESRKGQDRIGQEDSEWSPAVADWAVAS